jgi:hypothetical protein
MEDMPKDVFEACRNGKEVQISGLHCLVELTLPKVRYSPIEKDWPGQPISQKLAGILENHNIS